MYVPFTHVLELDWGLRSPLGQVGIFSLGKMNKSRDVCLNKFKHILIFISKGMSYKNPVGNYSSHLRKQSPIDISQQNFTELDQNGDFHALF